METRNQIIKATFNESKRTVTLRTYQEGNYISKYRTYPMNKQEFESCKFWTNRDWQAFLKTEDYYRIK